MLNSLSAFAAAGSTSAATPRVTRSFFMWFLLRQSWKIRGCVRRGGTHGAHAAEKRPAWPSVPGGVVGPVKLELQKDLARACARPSLIYKRAIERLQAGLQAGANRGRRGRRQVRARAVTTIRERCPRSRADARSRGSDRPAVLAAAHREGGGAAPRLGALCGDRLRASGPRGGGRPPAW